MDGSKQQARAVYPFKAGDVVVCKDARGTRLVEGRVYLVDLTSQVYMFGTTTDWVELRDDRPGGRHASRFCDPSEYSDMKINTVASGLRDQLADMTTAYLRERTYAYDARRELVNMVEERDHWITKFNRLRDTFRAVVKACE